MTSPEERLREFADDPDTSYVCPRFHGPDDPFFIRQKLRNGAPGVQGRGTCSRCQHQCFFTPRTNLLLGGVARICAQCALELAGAPRRVFDQLRDDLSQCPEAPCPYGGANDVRPA